MLIEFELIQTHQLHKCRAVLKGTFPRRLLMEMCDTVCLSDEVISDIPTLVELSRFAATPSTDNPLQWLCLLHVFVHINL